MFFKTRKNVPLDAFYLALASFNYQNDGKIYFRYINVSTRQLLLNGKLIATFIMRNNLGLITGDFEMLQYTDKDSRLLVGMIDLFTDPVNVPVYSNEMWLVGGREISAFLRTSAVRFKLQLAMCNSTDY